MSKTSKTSKTSKRSELDFRPLLQWIKGHLAAKREEQSNFDMLTTRFLVMREKHMDWPKAQFHAKWVEFVVNVAGQSPSYACRVSKAAGVSVRERGGGRKARPLHERIIAKVSEVKLRDGESLGKRELAEVMRAIAAQFTA